ncbi:MAG: hypothetical protein R2727_08745 [Bacteroidales bacterium]
MAGAGKAGMVNDPDSGIKWALRTLYYSQRVFASKNGYYTDNIAELENLGYEATKPDPTVLVTNLGFEAKILSGTTGKTWIINQDGLITFLH